jgi:hypothetical protein
MCGEKADAFVQNTGASEANQVVVATEPDPKKITGETEVITSSEVQERLKRMSANLDEIEASKESTEQNSKPPPAGRSSRSFSETMWFIRGLDFDRLVDDSEEMRQDDLQDRYEDQKEVRDGIRRQFSLSTEFDGGADAEQAEPDE